MSTRISKIHNQNLKNYVSKYAAPTHQYQHLKHNSQPHLLTLRSSNSTDLPLTFRSLTEKLERHHFSSNWSVNYMFLQSSSNLLDLSFSLSLTNCKNRTTSTTNLQKLKPVKQELHLPLLISRGAAPFPSYHRKPQPIIYTLCPIKSEERDKSIWKSEIE